MAIPNIVFNTLNGQLGTQGAGQDYISGFIFFVPALNTKIGLYTIISVQDAITKLNLSYNTVSGTIGITTNPTSGSDTAINIAYTVNGTAVQLVTNNIYTLVSSDFGASSTLLSNLVSAINKNTSVTGVSAYISVGVTSSSIVLIGLPDAVVTLSLTAQGTGSTGVYSAIISNSVSDGSDVLLYHISQYFELNNTGLLYLNVLAVKALIDGTEVTALQSYAGGSIRQIAIFRNVAYSSTTVQAETSTIQNILQVGSSSLDYLHTPIDNILFSYNFSSVSDLTTLFNFNNSITYKCSIDLSQSGTGIGYSLFKKYSYSISNIGAILGAISTSSVSQSVANPNQSFNLQINDENIILAFANGILYNSKNIQDLNNLLTFLDNYRYITLRQFTGLAGSYITNDNTLSTTTGNDYAYISSNRVIDKAKRLIYIALLPYLSGRIYLNADGTISNLSASSLSKIVDSSLDIMVQQGDLSGRSAVIPTNQNITQTGILQVNVKLLPVDIARTYLVNIGFALNL